MWSLVHEGKYRQCSTKSNSTWIDENLELLIQKSIPVGIDLPSSLLPRCLDKPVHSATSLSYANILKKQFSLALTPTTPETAHHQPPRKWQATILDYDSDQSAEPTLSTTIVTNSIKNPGTSPSTTATTTSNYAVELLSIKTELTMLKTIIATAMEQMKSAIASLTVPPQPSKSSNMDTDDGQSTASNHSNPNTHNLSALIKELKNEITTFVHKTRALFQPQAKLMQTVNPQSSFVT